MTTTPRQRLRFSLRTLFVVVTLMAIVAAWVAYHLEWIRQRNAWRAPTSNLLRSTLGNDPPGLLWIFRERGESWIEVKHGTAELVAAVQQAFPEAVVLIEGEAPTEEQRARYRRMGESSRVITAPPPPAPTAK